MMPEHWHLPKETIERLLATALSRGGDFAEVYLEHTVTNNLWLEEDKIKAATRGISQGVGIRVVSGEQTGYAHSDDLSFEKLAEAARVASYIADTPGETRAVSVTPRGVPRYISIGTWPAEVEAKAKADLLWRANAAAKGYDPRIIQVMAAFGDSTKEILIANSEGLLVTERRVLCRFTVQAIAEEKGRREMGYYAGGGTVGFEHYLEFPPEDIAREAARQSIVQLSAVEAPTGVHTVVLSNGWCGVLLHEAVGHGFEGDFIRKKTSFYTDRLGQKVASELCTVVDDGTLPGRRGTINVDDEGTPAQRTVLIEKGILTAYLYDKLNARLMATQSTGNGRRQSFRHIPLPRMTNTFLLAGEHDPEEILRSVPRGLFAKSLGGGQVDTTSGNFVFHVTEGYLLEDGKITRPVKGATLIGNGPEILTQITMVGSDLAFDPGIGTCGKDGQSTPVGVGQPTVRIDAMTVGGTAVS